MPLKITKYFGIAILLAALAYGGKWSYDRLKVAERIYVFLVTSPQLSNGKSAGAESRADRLDQLYLTHTLTQQDVEKIVADQLAKTQVKK